MSPPILFSLSALGVHPYNSIGSALVSVTNYLHPTNNSVHFLAFFYTPSQHSYYPFLTHCLLSAFMRLSLLISSSLTGHSFSVSHAAFSSYSGLLRVPFFPLFSLSPLKSLKGVSLTLFNTMNMLKTYFTRIKFSELQIPVCTLQPNLYIHLEISDISKIYVYPVFWIGSLLNCLFTITLKTYNRYNSRTGTSFFLFSLFTKKSSSIPNSIPKYVSPTQTSLPIFRLISLAA